MPDNPPLGTMSQLRQLGTGKRGECLPTAIGEAVKTHETGTLAVLPRACRAAMETLPLEVESVFTFTHLWWDRGGMMGWLERRDHLTTLVRGQPI